VCATIGALMVLSSGQYWALILAYQVLNR